MPSAVRPVSPSESTELVHNRTSLLAAVLAVSSVAVGAGVGASPAMAGVGPWHYVAGDAGTDREDTVS